VVQSLSCGVGESQTGEAALKARKPIPLLKLIIFPSGQWLFCCTKPLWTVEELNAHHSRKNTAPLAPGNQNHREQHPQGQDQDQEGKNDIKQKDKNDKQKDEEVDEDGAHGRSASGEDHDGGSEGARPAPAAADGGEDATESEVDLMDDDEPIGSDEDEDDTATIAANGGVPKKYQKNWRNLQENRPQRCAEIGKLQGEHQDHREKKWKAQRTSRSEN